MRGIDVSAFLDTWEHLLRFNRDTNSGQHHSDILAALIRWQTDPMIAPACRQRAKQLVREFRSDFGAAQLPRLGVGTAHWE